MRVVGIAQPCPSRPCGYGAGSRDESRLRQEQAPPNEQHVEQRAESVACGQQADESRCPLRSQAAEFPYCEQRGPAVVGMPAIDWEPAFRFSVRQAVPGP